MPPSTNNLFINVPGKGRVRSERYKTWRRAAENLYLAQKRGCVAVEGHFRADIVLSSKRRRKNSDADNFIKAALDFLQSMNLIENDALADRVSVEWGEAEEGCRVFIMPSQQAEAA
ncbi:MAG: RusA family crossover junction endodeoxyribonuclease [Hyphomicrobiales bacterium]|nr:RusA family crossover junction endodeoxyribonuclease [Hyphomicrobiales bacterium]